MIEIEGGNAFLNPHLKKEYDEEKGPIFRLIKSELPVLVSLVNSSIDPTNKENIEAYCKYQNEHQNNHNNNRK